MDKLTTDALPAKSSRSISNQICPDLDINILSLIEEELDDEDKLSIIFLMLNNYRCFDDLIYLYHENDKNHIISQYLNRIPNWKTKFVEALCITNNRKVIASLGLDFNDLEVKHCPGLSKVSTNVNVGAKILYKFFESLTNDERISFLLEMYKKIERDQRLHGVEVLELHGLYWISQGYISIYPDGGDMKNLLKCLKSLGKNDKPYYCDIDWYCEKKQVNPTIHNNNDVQPGEIQIINKGICLIINEADFSSHKTEYENRDGSEVDVANLKKTFGGLGFQIVNFTNLKRKEIITKVTDFSTRDDEKYDCFIICILSHGQPENIVSVDNKLIGISTIDKMMCTKTMRHTLKLLIIQACQGNTVGRHQSDDLCTDGGPYNDNLSYCKEFCLFSSTIKDHVSYRHKKEGSWFITDICSVLQKNRKRPISLDDWKREVIKEVQERKGDYPQNLCAQLPEMARDRSTKKFYFPPYKN